MARTERVETEHRWFEYGRWFYGYGPSMDGHRCAPELNCQVREVNITTTTEATEWVEKYG